LQLDRADGLAQVIDDRLEVTTQGLQNLRGLLHRMRGGSVGVSGPRGAGKTTAIRRFCEGREQIGDRPLLTVMVSAPIGAPSRPLVIRLLIAHGALVIPFGLGVWESAGRKRPAEAGHPWSVGPETRRRASTHET
jgi:hypothetical protein